MTLRLLGPAVEVAGLLLFLVGAARPKPVLGLPVRTWGVIVLAVGLIMVIVGLALSFGPGRRRKSPPDDLQLHL